MHSDNVESFDGEVRLARAFDAVSREPAPAVKACVFILLFGLTSLGTQFVCLRLLQMLGGASVATLSALISPAIITAAAAIAAWHWRVLQWWWIVIAAVPWLTIAGAISWMLYDRFV